ncbi:MAG: hypothetical protein I3273_07785 [Candidatus Moeniiplasma glomeromycotorum]|nr:hypothetical protein [Candidatus Moeniiplasma glomeromycotorum]MCE8167785.1 hypothetical protein [Candidatus Moeniiplasma glomeromycotorum]MCE8169980.1 hypothetical protein [Candidatus Moeniiplasma glomeromycotorum]
MTYENNLNSIIENKKPVELVQELKDEYQVPSYDKFMENYSVDEKLSNNYENEFDSKNSIAVPYRYGPGNDQSKQTAAKAGTTLAIGVVTAFCPPVGLGVAAGTMATGALTLSVSDANDKADKFARDLGSGMVESGAKGVVGGIVANRTLKK